MSIICLATIFYPNESNVENMVALSNQADRLFICDNTPDIDNSAMFDNIGKNITYLPNKRNLGLSCAFNVVLKNSSYGFSDNDYCMFFDQDSRVDEGHIKRLVEIYGRLESAGIKVGVLGASYYDETSEEIEIAKIKNPVPVENCFSVPQVITSSAVMRYKTLRELNFWSEEIFLDFADWDLCFRAKKVGYEVVVTTSILLKHKLGEGIRKIGFIKMHYDAPVREYYQIRDAMKLMKKNYVPLKFRFKFFIVSHLRPVCNVIFLQNRLARCDFIRKAWKDYKLGFNFAFEVRSYDFQK